MISSTIAAEPQVEKPKDLWSYEQAFSRNLGLISQREQEKLRNSRVAIAGMGGVGGVHLVTLARLGIGKFTIADPDTFELANTNRQHGCRTDTLGRNKAEVMAEEALRINPELDLRVFQEPIGADNVDEFLADADLFVDGLEFFEIGARRLIFARAAEMGQYAVTAGPMGFGTAWLVFDPEGMRFDDYFDFHDQHSPLEHLAAFAVGLTPALLQRPYLDLKHVSLIEQRGPSSSLACQLCCGVAAVEALKILLERGSVRCLPAYWQFDPYRGILRKGRLLWGNRHPVQRLKRAWLMRRFRAEAC
jgi:molybdopterin/thiamine biosynthesis adenylyltransferase